MFSIYAPAA